MLDWPEGVCAGQVGFEYPATSVLFSNVTCWHQAGPWQATRSSDEGRQPTGGEFPGANLQGAEADERIRWPAGWDLAKAESRGLQYRD
jgi:hypothetical protein